MLDSMRCVHIDLEHLRRAMNAYGETKPVPRKPKAQAKSSKPKVGRPAPDAPYLPRPDYPTQEPVKLPPGKAHGTATVYSHYKCRCAECREWATRYKREREAIRAAGGGAPKRARKKPGPKPKPKPAQEVTVAEPEPSLWRQCMNTIRIDDVVVRCVWEENHNGKCRYEAPPSRGATRGNSRGG